MMMVAKQQLPMFLLPPPHMHVLTREQFTVLTYLLLMNEIPADRFPSRPHARVMRLLISLRLVDVIALSPAQYRVTQAGRAARSTYLQGSR